MGIFTKNRTSNIGLDVSSTAVKLLEFGKELVDNEPRYRILNYAVVPLQPMPLWKSRLPTLAIYLIKASSLKMNTSWMKLTSY